VRRFSTQGFRAFAGATSAAHLRRLDRLLLHIGVGPALLLLIVSLMIAIQELDTLSHFRARLQVSIRGRLYSREEWHISHRPQRCSLFTPSFRRFGHLCPTGPGECSGGCTNTESIVTAILLVLYANLSHAFPVLMICAARRSLLVAAAIQPDSLDVVLTRLLVRLILILLLLFCLLISVIERSLPDFRSPNNRMLEPIGCCCPHRSSSRIAS